jgi:hypothetical protein
MQQDDHPELLAALANTPAFLERALRHFSAADVRTPPKRGGFSLVEQIWHLADLEHEGYAERIRRILGEDDPELPDFDGDRIARERRYAERDVHEGLAQFKAAREHNLTALRHATTADRARGATQEAVGRIRLADVPHMMTEHDRGQREEIEVLLRELSR